MLGLGADPLVFFGGALLLLTVPLPWLMAAGLSMAVHECFHYAAIRLLGGQAHSLQFYAQGARMAAAPLSPGRELLCALAGPAGSLSLLLLLPLLPRTALCGLIQGLYNLLPIYPLDGGRILSCTARLWGLERFLPCVDAICTGLAFFLVFAGAQWFRLGFFPVFSVIVLILRKIPCKPELAGVQ